MNKLQLTKGELTKIILEEVRNLNEQDASSKNKIVLMQEVGNLLTQISSDLSNMDETQLNSLRIALSDAGAEQ